MQSALAKNAPITLLESALTKTQDLKSFRIRTYEKGGGRGRKLLTNPPSFPFRLATTQSSTINPPAAAQPCLGHGYNGARTYKENATMNYRRFGRSGWKVSEIGYGMWGIAGWTGSEDAQSFESLQRAIDLGCNFFDTAWAYGDGHSEQLLGKVLRANAGEDPLHGHENPAEKSQMAQHSAIHARRLLSAGLYRGIRHQKFGQHRCRHARPDPVSHLGRRLAGRPALASRASKNCSPAERFAHWASASIAGSPPTA